MAATITVRRWTGTIASPTKTDVTSATTRLSTSDAPTPGTSDPIPVPTTATPNYSYWASFRLQATTTPAGTIDNLRWFSDGGNGFGTGVEMTGQSLFQTGYVRATGSQGSTGNLFTPTNHTGMTAIAVSAFSFTSGSPKTLAGSVANPNTGDFGQFFAQQLRVVSSAGPGTLTAETFTFRYDET